MDPARYDEGTGAPAPDEAYAAFVARYPAYRATGLIDDLRATDYPQLDESHHAYLDWTGAALYAERQIAAHKDILRGGVYGNPHSRSPASLAASGLVDRARASVLDYFSASPDEYVAIFTPNATGALRLVGESYPFRPGGQFVALADNHNSVNGIREFARARGAAVGYVPVVAPELRADRAALEAALAKTAGNRPSLFAYPAQSNFTGVKHPLDYIGLAHDRGWHVVLDAAAYVPTDRLDLRAHSPDFVAVSFYKMFGYPTGVGVLLARRSVLGILQRPWFSGGTIRIASVMAGKHYLADGEAGFEDGTLDYLSLPAVEIGLRLLRAIGLETIHRRVGCLTGWLLEQLLALRHRDGTPLVRIYGPAHVRDRGGTVAFNLLDPAGEPMPSSRIEELAAAEGISVRTGCFCNPGVGEIAHELNERILGEIFSRPEGPYFAELESLMRARYGKNVSAIRASIGLATNFADVYRLVDLLARFRDTSVDELDATMPRRPRPVRMRDTA
jgi:selenocysteine lyase/cysteine desulfurase